MESTPVITFRHADRKDMEALFAWRNSPESRKYSTNNQIIDWETHKNWFRKVLTSTDHILLIGEIDQQPIGVLRFDINENTAEISIYMVPGLASKGFGTDLLKKGTNWITKKYPQIKELRATILTNNKASIRIFEKAGYHPYATSYIHRT